MAKESTGGMKERLVEAALALAAENGWAHTGFAAIAAKAGIPLYEMREYFDDKSDILAAYGRIVDKKSMESVGEADPGISPRDRLFDLLMARFDVLNENRSAVLSILESFCLDPKQAVIGLPHIARSMAWMLEAAQIETTSLKGSLKVAGLAGLYLKTLRVWKEDDSSDMAKTMAALDQSLGHAAQWAQRLSL